MCAPLKKKKKKKSITFISPRIYCFSGIVKKFKNSKSRFGKISVQEAFAALKNLNLVVMKNEHTSWRNATLNFRNMGKLVSFAFERTNVSFTV